MGEKSRKARERWYYDACTLDKKNVYFEIINKKRPKEAIISHLSLGEAYGNCHIKGKQPRSEALSAFSGFIEELRLGGHITIVGNDDIEDELDDIRDMFKDLSITDAIHLATAIKYKCGVFVTTDHDFLKLPKNELNKLAERFELDKLVIIKMPDR
jgi:predicted nucleic acid-binding protein